MLFDQALTTCDFMSYLLLSVSCVISYQLFEIYVYNLHLLVVFSVLYLDGVKCCVHYDAFHNIIFIGCCVAGNFQSEGCRYTMVQRRSLYTSERKLFMITVSLNLI